MEHDRHDFLSFRTVFCPFSPLTTHKIKILKKKQQKKHTHTHEDIIILQICTINDSHIYVCILPEIWSAMDRIFFVILDCLLSFYLPNNLKNQNFEKMKKTPGEMFYGHLLYHKWQSYYV